jgi:hypothetical protein
VAQLPTFPPPQEDLTPLDLSPDPLPDGVVAAVDGEPITEAELSRLTQAAPGGEDPEALRTMALMQLVERRLLLAKADQMDVKATEAEVQRAVEEVARTNGLTVTELEQEVVDTGWTWDDYRNEVIAQIVEMKVLDINGVFAAGQPDSEAAAVRRERFLGCLRARAEIQVRDQSVTLPPNPFAVVADIAELRFSGEVGLPEPELHTAALEAAKTRVRLCDALTSAQLALEELYFERGFLEAKIQIPWPEDTTPPLHLEVMASAGRPHVIGRISFDQSAAPRAKRLDPKELRERVAAFVTEGQVATMSAMQAATREVTAAFQQGGLGTIEATVERKQSKKRVTVNIRYRLLGSEI